MTKKIQSINPFTGELNAEFSLLTREELSEKIDLAYKTFLEWRKTPNSKKKELMLKFADIIEENQAELAEIETKEMGMLYNYSFAGLSKTANLIRWFANNFEEILAKKEFESNGLNVIEQYDPIGVIYGVAPWNFPFNQVLRAAVPNVLAGNTTVYKHASNTPIAGAKIEELFLKAGFPAGVYQNIFVSGSESEYILSRKEVQGVNLTGSEGAGSAVGALAGKYLKRSVLELGGNDAFIVATTSDIKKIAEEAIKARISNNGQKCNSSKRFLVPEKYYDEFCKYAVEFTKNLVIGDPMDEKTQIGPMARADLVDEIHSQVEKTIGEGAKLLIGGEKLDRKGYFYAPTILADVTPEMTSYKEEIFGPVASIIKVKDLDEAVKLANNSDFGLCGCVYGDDFEELKEIASQIETGMVFVNKPAASQASLPFGGVKKSGYGKENGPDGLKAFTNKKVIVL
ncbi:NAD-dependent succinate-semialdehyde dehydrogenase [Candidatus Gracilibacteria bacterium]|nr:MAG: NAD-dependent succinate-semialdehyde dehydrogenase [Candidatus Gracilibacteria bacterium]